MASKKLPGSANYFNKEMLAILDGKKPRKTSSRKKTTKKGRK